MIATPKTKLLIEPLTPKYTSDFWRCYVDSEETMTKLENLPSEYGTIRDKQRLNFMIILNPCYKKSDIFKAMYELVGEEPPTKILETADREKDIAEIEKDVAAKQGCVTPTDTVTVPTDHADAEKDSAKELFGN